MAVGDEPAGGSDVFGVGGGPVGEQLDEVGVEGDHAVVAELDDSFAVLWTHADDQQVASLFSLEHDAVRVRFTVPAPDGTFLRPALDGGLHVFTADGAVHSYDAEGGPRGTIDIGAPATGFSALDPATGSLAAATDGGLVVIDPASGTVDPLPGNDSVANLGFARNGQLLIITSFDGSVRVWDLERGEPAGLVREGTGAWVSSPSWYDETTDSIWVFASGRLLEVPLDPQRWVERACDLVGRDLTSEEWVRYVLRSRSADTGANRTTGADSVPKSACN